MDERLNQRLEELLEEIKEISNSLVATHGGNNLQCEIKRMADSMGSAQYELSRIATALERLVEELTR